MEHVGARSILRATKAEALATLRQPTSPETSAQTAEWLSDQVAQPAISRFLVIPGVPVLPHRKSLHRYRTRMHRQVIHLRQPTRCSAERSLWPKSMPGCRLSAPSLARRWIVDGQICGFGVESYLLALRAAVAQSKSIRPPVFVFKDPLTRWIHGGNEILGRIAHLIAFGSAADFDDCGITR